MLPIILTIVVITLFVIYVRLRKNYNFSDKKSWKLVDSDYEEWPKRPSSFPKEKNKEGIYVDRIAFIQDTVVAENPPFYSFRKIAGDVVNSLPLYTTIHSNEEHYLTTINISFHIEDKNIYMDILSLDKDFPLKDNNQFSLLFTNGAQWDFVFSKSSYDDYAASILLSKDQLVYLSINSIDKWRLRRDKDDYFTVGGLNFEIRKYIYKPELQTTIKMMAQKLLTYLQ